VRAVGVAFAFRVVHAVPTKRRMLLCGATFDTPHHFHHGGEARVRQQRVEGR